MADLKLTAIRKRYGDLPVIKGIDLHVRHGEFIVFVGPSGCGKSTLLRMIAGLEAISDGDLLIDGRRVNDLPPAQRGVAMVFQSYALYPHMSVADNMGFGLKLAGIPKAERRRKVNEAASVLQLEPLLTRTPKTLSGGQRQRVAIGRAIVRQPRVFLFDEPLSNLDAALRVQMRLELARLHEQLDATMIYVTHDQVEALTLADRIVVLDGGRVMQTGSPMHLYHQPDNLFVAGFIGSPTMNTLPVTVDSVDEEGIRVRLPGGGSLSVPMRGDGVTTGTALTLGLRPEHIVLSDTGDLRGEVTALERLGSETYLYIALAPDGRPVIVKAPGDNALRPHSPVGLRLDGAHCHLFDSDGKALGRRALLDGDDRALGPVNHPVRDAAG